MYISLLFRVNYFFPYICVNPVNQPYSLHKTLTRMSTTRIDPAELWKLKPEELSATMYNTMFSFINQIYPISEELEEEIVKNSEIVKFKRGSIILKHNDICRYCYFAGCGLARAYYITDEGEDVSSWFMKEGDIIITVQSFFDQVPSREELHALEDTICIGLTHEALQEIYLKFPEFNFVGRVLTQKYYIQMEERAFSLRMDSAEEKYLKLEQHSPEIIARVSLKDIASYLGIAPGTISRIRTERK